MARALTLSDYKVGIICALPLEQLAVELMLDQRHSPPTNGIPRGDKNDYAFGRIGNHNVVIASLAGDYGIVSAAIVASNLKRSFPHIRAGLMVGIAAGIPRPGASDGDLRLGDIVVGCNNRAPSVVNFKHGTNVRNGFELRSELADPPETLVKAVAALKLQHKQQGPTYLRHLAYMLHRYPQYNDPTSPWKSYNHPLVADILFKASFPHEREGESCRVCYSVQGGEVLRQNRTLDELPNDLLREKFVQRTASGSVEYPVVFTGTIASSNSLMKNPMRRDQVYELIRQQRNVKALCIEMEAAGIVKALPCLVIRGLCDYADSHKNDVWQNFAAATAAAYAKDLLYSLQSV